MARISRYRAVLLAAVLGFQALALASDAEKPFVFTPDGARYYGPLVDGVMHGVGEIRYQDGRKYRGEFSRGQIHGSGRYEHGGGVYEGEFKEGAFTGKGRYTDPQGTVYEGSFVQWTLQGPGKATTKSGDVYVGEFQGGMYHGKGTLTYAKPREDGRTSQSGTWRWGSLQDPEAEKKMQAALEAALYEQKPLLDKSLAALQPGTPGRIDMYLLAVGGDGSQEVFRREVDFVRAAFAERFGTAGRTVALVNSRNTLATLPMATVTSIRAALQAIAARMDRDEDILFLFMTSHGSRDHELVLNQRGMPLRGLPAARLGELLRESGIRWKVVLVSACYSGGFIAPVKDERTMVITAARRDRRSFGCADENDFTYFGRAFFKEALPGAKSFGQAFEKASSLVDEWERADAAKTGKPAPADHHSLPQIHSPIAIEAHLERWWRELGR